MIKIFVFRDYTICKRTLGEFVIKMNKTSFNSRIYLNNVIKIDIVINFDIGIKTRCRDQILIL